MNKFELKKNTKFELDAIIHVTTEGSITCSIRRSNAACIHNSITTIIWSSVSKFSSKVLMYNVVETDVILITLKQKKLNKHE